MKFKCIIVDDEPPAIRLIEKYVEKVGFLEHLGSFDDSLKALEFLNKTEVDVIFLDIQMPQLTGLQLSKIISRDTRVIFTTAYPDFALKGFELNAVDYLLKPISFERFYQAVAKLQHVIKPAVADAPQQEFLFVKTDGKNKFTKVFLRDIIYIEGLQNYVCLHLSNGQIITLASLKSLLDSLPQYDFVQIHKSYIVSLKQIESTDSFSVFIGGKELPIGGSYKEGFFRRIGENRV